MKILLVEDDLSIAEPLAEGLTTSGFTVQHVSTGRAALDVGTADLVLLDLGLPDMDGRDVFRTLRQHSNVPVIMLTARGDEFDRVLGLELGADDYVTKPFSLRELIARVRAVSRRLSGVESASGSKPGDTDSVQTIGRLRVDRRTRRVLVDDAEVHLTAKEFDLLAYLTLDPGAVRTRTEILESVWDEHWFGPSKTVDAHVASLRRKLGGHQWIEAVRGVGFRLEPQ